MIVLFLNFFKMTRNNQDTYQFDGSEMISDILSCMPESAEILFSHGLGCIECSFNMNESLQNGVLGHGFDIEDLKRILIDLNEAAEDLKIPKDIFLKSNPRLEK